MPDCPFCDINGFTENKLCYARHDKFPVSKGHALVIPKRHVETWFDLSEEEQFDAVRLVNLVKEYLDAEYSPTGFNVAVNCGLDAGQTVLHAHIHVIPRYEGDVEEPSGGVRCVIPGKQKYKKD